MEEKGFNVTQGLALLLLKPLDLPANLVLKLIREKLDTEFDISRKWASQAYSILKKRQEERKVARV